MKKLFSISCLLLCILFVSAQKPPEHADAILKQACEIAGKEDKNVMIIFTASWCGWCKKMDKSIDDPACKDFFAKNYVIRHLVIDESKANLNLENPGAKEFRTKYNGDGQGIPFWLIFDKNGNMLADSKMRKEKDGPRDGDNTGCPANEKEVNYFISVLQKTSKISPEQTESVRKRFRENDQ